MPVMDERGAGVDVHKQPVVAGVVTPTAPESRPLSTMTMDVLALSAGLVADGGTPVAMERTGDYGKPGFTRRDGTFAVWLVQAPPVNAGPGRTTDGQDAAWLAELRQHGLWRARCIPPVAQRARRDLTRDRSTFLRERVTLLHRGQTRLAEAHITLAAVAAASMGVSGRAMLAALRAGRTAPQALAELAQGRLRAQRDLLAQALAGRVQPPHRVVLTALFCHIDSRDETRARFETQLHASRGPFEGALGRLATIPGVARPTADMIVAESGTAMRRVPRADPVASWAGVAPGHHASAGQRLSGKTRQGHRFVRTVLVPAAHAAARTQGT
jgi:transposase